MMIKQYLVLIFVFLLASVSFGQLYNNRLSVQGYLKTGVTPVNDLTGFPMRFLIKKNSTVVWCQSSAANVPVVSGVFSSILSGASNCLSLSNALNPSVFVHSASSDTFIIDVIVDTSKDGFGGADDATFAGINLVPSPMSLTSNVAEVANSLSITLPVSSGGTGATTAADARTNLGLGTVAAINTSGVATDVLLGDGTFGPAPSAITSVAGKTGVVTLVSADISDAVSTNIPSRLVLRDAGGNFAANSITASIFSSVAGGVTNIGDNTSAATTNVNSGSGGLNISVTGASGNISITPGSTAGAVTIGNASTGLTTLGNTGGGAVTTIASPMINIGSTGTNTTTTVGTVTGTSTTVIQAGSGKVRVGAAGAAFSAMGACTIAAAAITNTAANRTCTGVPATTAVAVYCTPAAALTTPNSNSLFCRATGTASQLSCNTTVANTVSTTYNCMWMQP